MTTKRSARLVEKRQSVVLPPEVAAALSTWRLSQSALPSIPAALRFLVRCGLESEGIKFEKQAVKHAEV